MLTETQDKILSFLLRHPGEHVTIRGITRGLDRSYTLVYNNISNLEKKSIIQKQSVPPAQIITLHKIIPTHILIDIELKIKEVFLNKFSWVKVFLNDILRSIKNPFFILVVFGSYAKGTQTKKSDIDLLIITQAKNQIKEIGSSINKIYTKIKKNVIIIDVNDFLEMISNPNVLNVGNEVKKHHVILYGVEQYYQIIEKIEKQ